MVTRSRHRTGNTDMNRLPIRHFPPGAPVRDFDFQLLSRRGDALATSHRKH